MNGIILVNKDINCTSRDIVNDICHIFNTKKVGHTGTLDPIARGVLVVTIGKYTKLNEVLTSEYKEYIAEFIIGKSTDTLDITGNIIEDISVVVDENKILDALKHFTKSYLQEVPAYSAVKVNGKKLYEYARKKEIVDLPKRVVSIKSIDLISIKDNKVTFKCLVSKGTYIRSLIRDIGTYLKVPTCMVSLIRTKQGIFSLEESYTIDDIRNNKYKILGLEDVLDLEIINVDEDLYNKIYNGCKLGLDACKKDYILFKYCDEDICLYKRTSDNYQMFIKIKE